ncbi:MAG: Fe-S cluster assembly ATPase SufC [Gemmatimonadales bacterium]|jgi:Fe-S cluster assembly ATP-binding protein
MLEVKNLQASIDENEILKGIDLSVKPGEVHAIMGPNGSGKSTFAQVLAGHPAYEVTGGSVSFEGQDLLEMDADERARAGVFLAFQYPVAIRGVTNAYFLQSAVNARRKEQGIEELDTLDFAEMLERKLEQLGWDDSLIHRAVNDGFSGGEKKRNEIIQLAMLEPKLAILDETDSGLDIDAVKAVSEAVNSFRSPDRAFVLVTHYERILNYVTPDRVHVLARGKVVLSGDMELALKLEAEGYDWVTEAAAGVV